VIRRLRVEWPDPAPFRSRGGRPIRWLAVSDDEEPALTFDRNRDEVGPLDAIVGAGDLQPDYLGFLADAFKAPMVYVRGNHDRGGAWAESARNAAAEALPSGAIEELDNLPILALEWPGVRHRDRRRHDGTASLDVLRLAIAILLRRLLRHGGPVIVLSHAPPLGVGDGREDPYHVGFSAYRWLLDRFRPPLWLHGHVHPASVEQWRIDHHGSQVVNVTGAVLVEIVPPSKDALRQDGTRSGSELDGRHGQVDQPVAPRDTDTDGSPDGIRAESSLEIPDALDGLTVEVEDEVAGSDTAGTRG
jgi:hypothetical protein